MQPASTWYQGGYERQSEPKVRSAGPPFHGLKGDKKVHSNHQQAATEWKAVEQKVRSRLKPFGQENLHCEFVFWLAGGTVSELQQLFPEEAEGHEAHGSPSIWMCDESRK